MRSRWNSLVVGGCNVFGLALLALSATAPGSMVRAQEPSTLQSIVFEPLTKIVAGLEQRLADLEAAMAGLADSFTARRIATHELCVADDSGAQTCITRAQLDALLRGAVQTGQALPAIAPSTTEQTAAAEKPVSPAAPLAVVATPSEPPLAVEPSGTSLPLTQAGEGRAGDIGAAAPEVAAATPRPPAAAGSGADAPPPAEATLPPRATEPAKTVVAASAKPEAPIQVERPTKDEEGAPTGSTDTNSAVPEPKAAPAEVPPASERLE